MPSDERYQNQPQASKPNFSRGYCQLTVIHRRADYKLSPLAGAACANTESADRGISTVTALLRRVATALSGLLSYWRGAV